MRILMMTWACDLEDVSEPGVSARWVREISKDHDVTVFAVSKPERYGCVAQQFPELEVIEWQDVRLPKSLERFRAIVKPGYLPYYLKARRFLRSLLQENDFDVIHHLSPFAWRYPSPAVGLGVPVVRGPVAGGLRTPPGLAGETAAGPRFMFLRRSDGWRIKLDPVLRKSYRQTDHLLMAVPYMREFLSPLPLGESSIEIEHGLEQLPAARIDGTPRESVDQLNLLFVGRIIPTKGLRLAIRALVQAKNPAALRLTVIGDGDDMPGCRDEAAKLGLQDRVRFLGWCSPTTVEQHYRQADVFLFPSFREPTGGVLLEAMAQGLPSITCAYGGPDYLIDDSCGIKVPPAPEGEFVRNLALAIDRLATSTELRQQMGKMAYARARDDFGWTAKRQRMAQLYARLARAHGIEAPTSGLRQP